METRTEESVSALAAALAAQAALPMIRREERLPGKFDPDATGVGRFLNSFQEKFASLGWR